MRKFPPLKAAQKMLIYVAVSSNGGRGVTGGYRETIKPIEKKLGIELEKDSEDGVFAKCQSDKKGSEYTETELGIITGCLKSPQHKFNTTTDYDDAQALIVQLTGLEFHKEIPEKEKKKKK